MSKREKQIKVALAQVGFLNIVGEMCDELQGTAIYQQRNKNLINQLQAVITLQQRKLINDGFYQDFSIESQIQHMERAGENIIKIFQNSSIEEFEAFQNALENFANKQYVIEEV